MTQTIETRNTAALLGAAYMIGAGLLFAVVNTLVQSLTMQYGVVSTSVAFWQYFIALLFSLPWVMPRLRSALATDQLPLHIGRVILAAAGVQLWVLGLAHVPIWQAIALIMTSPFFVTFGARIFLGEQVGRERWLAVAVGFIGGMIILAPWSDAFSFWALLPIGAALLWGLSSLVTKRLTRSEGADTLTLYLLILLTPINAVLAFGSGFSLGTGNTLWLVLFAGILTAGAQYALARAYSVADAAYLQPFDHIKLPLNVVLGWLVFGFLPEGTMWLGILLILAASVYLFRHEASHTT
ncbi:MAG: DMT family transporter [Paracoccaceae bacterium]